MAPKIVDSVQLTDDSFFNSERRVGMKNFKLSFLESHILMKFLLSAFLMFFTGCSMLLENETPEDFYNVFTVYAFNIVAISYCCFVSNLSLNIKFYKALPLKSSDITAVNALSTLMGAGAFLLGASAVLALCGKAFLIPYYAAAMFIYAAISLAVMPLMFKTNKFGADAINAANEKSLRRRTVIAILGAIGFPLLGGIPGTVICVRGWKAGTFLMSDLPMLLTVCAVCIIVSVAVTLIYKKKIPYYVY